MKYILLALLSGLLTFSGCYVIFMRSGSTLLIETIHFSTADGQFEYRCVPAKGRDYSMMLSAFDKFKKEKGRPHDEKVYRISSRNVLDVGAWCRYKHSEEWQHEYLWWWKQK